MGPIKRAKIPASVWGIVRPRNIQTAVLNLKRLELEARSVEVAIIRPSDG
jgi:hypothetical protein